MKHMTYCCTSKCKLSQLCPHLIVIFERDILGMTLWEGMLHVLQARPLRGLNLAPVGICACVS